MADRIFGCIALAIALGYGFIAFTIIEAPFQYDPLGPETWPQILSVFACLCCLYIIILPDGTRIKVLGTTLLRIATLLILLSAYAYLYEEVGFMLSTTLFCLVLSRILGATLLQAVVFSVASGSIGYLLCAVILDLNLPEGVILKLLRGLS